MSAQGLAEVLAAHDDPPGWEWNAGDALVYECNCGGQSPPLSDDVISLEHTKAASNWHRAHVEAAVLAWVAGRLDEAREDVANTIGEFMSLGTSGRWIATYGITPEDFEDIAYKTFRRALGVDR